MNIRQDFTDIWEAFVSLFVGTFDPERDGLPPLDMAKEPTTRKKTRQTIDFGTVHHVGGARFQEQTPPDGIDSEWVNLETGQQRADRVPELTEADVAECEADGLDLVKAGEIKPLWAQGLTRGEISVRLGNGRFGYSPDTVKKYTAAFSRAAEKQDLG